MKSLQQASKKANSELMKQTNKIKAKQEIERKKLEKKEEAARKRELADLEDADAEPHHADDPVACTWTVYKNLAAIGHCENLEVLDMSVSDEDYTLQLSIFKKEFDHGKCVLVHGEDRSNYIMERLAVVDEELKDKDPKNADLLRKKRLVLGFPSFEEMLSPRMAENLEDFQWLTANYLKQHSSRITALDKFLT